MNFDIEIRPDDVATTDGARGVKIAAGAVVFTRLLRPDSASADDFVEAPPSQLAFWLVDNWWRLRWEGIPPSGMTPDWKLAHDLASIGGGYVWPRLSIWGEDPRIGFISRSDPQGVVGPVRYLTDALCFVEARNFERTVDAFLKDVVDAGDRMSSDAKALRAQLRALVAEREDAETADWRRLEARLGFDVDAAPESLIESFAALSRRFDAPSIEEAAMAAPGPGSAAVLSLEVEAAEASRIECDFSAAVRFCRDHAAEQKQQPPWATAERLSAALRRAADIPAGPLRNGRLAELISTRADSFARTSANRSDLAYGLRLRPQKSPVQKIAVRSRWSHDRRFEIARALGDCVWNDETQLGPMSAASSARQKFQRAFAQSLLCPFEDLREYLGDDLTDGGLFAAARYFHVSERMVRSILVNKQVIEHWRLLGPQRESDAALEERAEAA